MAEREGFEPSVRENRTPDFESGTIDHSAISPLDEIVANYLHKGHVEAFGMRSKCVQIP